MRLSAWLALLWGLVLAPLVAAADGPVLDVSGELDRLALDERVAVWRDEGGTAVIEDALAADASGRFLPAPDELYQRRDLPGALWLRLRVQSRAEEARRWLLDAGYPHLDEVSLFEPEGLGRFRVRTLGDRQPFAAREVAHPSLLFTLEEPPRSERTLYLRVVTTGILSVPLAASSARTFSERAYLDWAAPFAFYGVVLVVAASSLCLAALTRQRSPLYFALMALSIGLAQSSLFGHAYQYLFPSFPALQQRLPVLAISATQWTNALLARHHVEDEQQMPAWYMRVLDRLALASALSTLLVSLLPLRLGIALVTLAYPLAVASGFWVAIRLRIEALHSPHAPSTGWVDTLLLGWLSLLTGSTLHTLALWHVLPENLLTRWGTLLGATVQFVLIGASLSTRLSWLRRRGARLNAELVGKIRALSDALALVESETARCEAAVREKGEVIATMTHELRTPLNAIINVPEGLLASFPARPGALCGACGARFVREQGEPLPGDARCPECGTAHALREATTVEYEGEPERTLHHLALIERAGKHLLGVVDRILDAGRSEGGSLLSTAPVEVGAIARDVVEQLSAMAARAEVRVDVRAPAPGFAVEADELRLRQVLINLLGNALRFAPRQSAVRISVEARGERCVVSVRDHGPGIAVHKQAAIFDAYERAHAAAGYGGTGLGLSIARSLVRLHGGDIAVESEPGRGATFTFWIPARQRVERALSC